MEIGATSPPSYLPPQHAEPRVARTLAREGSVLPDASSTLARDRKETVEQKNPLVAVQERPNAAEANRLTEPQVSRSAKSERDRPASSPADETQSTRQPAEIMSSGGSIKMDVEDGNRVLQVYDSKDVLIYQLPPKGALMLIKAQEHAQQSQVQTSA